MSADQILEPTASGPLEVLVCEISEDACGIPLAAIGEVLRSVYIPKIPGSPALLEGVINLRGIPVPVIDVRVRFGLSAKENSVSDQIVTMRAGRRWTAVRVDRARELMRIGAKELEEGRNLAPFPEHIDGVALLPSGLAVICDPDRFLSQAEEEMLEALEAIGTIGKPHI